MKFERHSLFLESFFFGIFLAALFLGFFQGLMSSTGGMEFLLPFLISPVLFLIAFFTAFIVIPRNLKFGKNYEIVSGFLACAIPVCGLIFLFLTMNLVRRSLFRFMLTSDSGFFVVQILFLFLFSIGYMAGILCGFFLKRGIRLPEYEKTFCGLFCGSMAGAVLIQFCFFCFPVSMLPFPLVSGFLFLIIYSVFESKKRFFLILFLLFVFICCGFAFLFLRENRNDFFPHSVESSTGRYHFKRYGISYNGRTEFFRPDFDRMFVLTAGLQENRPGRKCLLVTNENIWTAHAAERMPCLDKVDILTPNPESARTFRSFLSQSDKVKIHMGEALSFMENGKEKYDLILFSVPDTHSLAGHRCFTLEMMRAVKKRLNPEGVFAMRLPHLPGYPEEAVSGFRRITASTVSNVFPHVLYTTGRNSILMASTGMSLTLSPDSLEKALEKCFSGKKHHIPSGLFFVAGPEFSKNAVRIDGNKTEQTVTMECSPKLLIHSWRNLPFLTNLKFLVQMYEFTIRHSSVILIFTLILYLVIRYFLTNRIDVKMLFFSFETGFFVLGTLSLLCFFFQIRTGELYLNMTIFLDLFSLGALLGKCIKKTRMIFILSGFLPFAAYLSSVLENLISAFVIYLSIFLLGICFGNAYDCFRKRSGEEKLSVFLPVAALSGGAIGLFLIPCIFLPVYGTFVCILLLFLTRFSRMLRG